MGYRPKKFTETIHALWKKEGRGTGEGASYTPWLQEGDVPTVQGEMVRFKCAKTGRRGVCFSSIEDRHRRYYETKATVSSIDEQFPLDRERTRRIARQLGIPHPADPKSRVDIVMTTDLVVRGETTSGKPFVLPRSVKASKDLSDFNNAEHGEIERRYWAENGCEWKFITESAACMPTVLIENLDLLFAFRFPLEEQPWDGYWMWLLRGVAEMTQKNASAARFDTWCSTLDHDLSLQPSHGRHALSFLIHREIIPVDLPTVSLRTLPANLLRIKFDRLGAYV